MAFSERDGLMQGAKWALIANWYARSIGLVNTIILLKLLKPEDFGIAALSTFFVSLFAAFSHVGIGHFVISSDSMSKQELDSIWSLGLAVKCVSAILLFFSAGFIADYVNKPEMEAVIHVVAILPLISGLRNVALDVAEKNYHFKRILAANMIGKTIGTVVSIMLAIYLESYWALIIGVIVIALSETVMGYILFPYRPRLTASHWSTQWTFSKWLYLSAIFGYMRSRIDVLILGNIVDSRSIGLYNIATEFAWLPFMQLVGPMNHGFFAVVSRVQNEVADFYYRIVKQMSLNMLILVPCGIGLIAIAEPFSGIVLGEEWRDAAPLLQCMAGLVIVMSSHGLMCSILTVKKQLKVIIASDAIIIVSIFVVFTTYHDAGIEQLAQLRFAIGAGFFLWLLMLQRFVIGIKAHDLLFLYLTPAVSGLVMYLMVVQTMAMFPSEMWQLCVGVLTGMVVYIPCMLLLAYSFRRRFPYYWECCEFVLRLIRRNRPAMAVKGG